MLNLTPTIGYTPMHDLNCVSITNCDFVVVFCVAKIHYRRKISFDLLHKLSLELPFLENKTLRLLPFSSGHHSHVALMLAFLIGNYKKHLRICIIKESDEFYLFIYKVMFCNLIRRLSFLAIPNHFDSMIVSNEYPLLIKFKSVSEADLTPLTET